MCKNGKCACNKTLYGCPSGRTPRFLQPCILLLLAKAPSYGYELMDNLKKGKFLETKPDAGAIYRVLGKLEDDKFITAKWQNNQSGPAKKIYSITAKGKKLLKEWAKSLQAKINSLDRFIKEYSNLHEEKQMESKFIKIKREAN